MTFLSSCSLFAFNNILVISWWSVLLVEETGGPKEKHRPVASHWQTLSHNVVLLALIEIRTHNIRGIGTDCIGSCKSNYYAVMTAPSFCSDYIKNEIYKYFSAAKNYVKIVFLYNFINFTQLNVVTTCLTLQGTTTCVPKWIKKPDRKRIFFF